MWQGNVESAVRPRTRKRARKEFSKMSPRNEEAATCRSKQQAAILQAEPRDTRPGARVAAVSGWDWDPRTPPNGEKLVSFPAP